MHILIVEAPFYTHIADMQREGVIEALDCGLNSPDPTTISCLIHIFSRDRGGSQTW
jgi:hypothetical protein